MEGDSKYRGILEFVPPDERKADTSEAYEILNRILITKFIKSNKSEVFT